MRGFVFHTPKGDWQTGELQRALATAVENLLLTQVVEYVTVPDGQEHGRVTITITDTDGKTLTASAIPRNCGLQLCTEREAIMHTDRDVWRIQPHNSEVRPAVEAAP